MFETDRAFSNVDIVTGGRHQFFSNCLVALYKRGYFTILFKMGRRVWKWLSINLNIVDIVNCISPGHWLVGVFAEARSGWWRMMRRLHICCVWLPCCSLPDWLTDWLMTDIKVVTALFCSADVFYISNTWHDNTRTKMLLSQALQESVFIVDLSSHRAWELRTTNYSVTMEAQNIQATHYSRI